MSREPLWKPPPRTLTNYWAHGNMDFLKPRYTPMSRRRRIYEGKAKVLYEGPEPGTLIQHFKDDATAFNAKKHEVIEGKGVLNNRISEYVFQHLNNIGVPTHFIRRLNMREQLIREVEIIPLVVVVRHVAAGSPSQRLGLEEGTRLPRLPARGRYRSRPAPGHHERERAPPGHRPGAGEGLTVNPSPVGGGWLAQRAGWGRHPAFRPSAYSPRPPACGRQPPLSGEV